MPQICIKADIPPALMAIDDECKAIYHSKDSFCIWTFANKEARDKFVSDSAGMDKAEREEFYIGNFSNPTYPHL